MRNWREATRVGVITGVLVSASLAPAGPVATAASAPALVKGEDATTIAGPAGGYDLVASDGGVFSFGGRYYGSTGGLALSKPIIGMATTPDGHGYWLVASDGGVFGFGDAAYQGSTGGVKLARPIVGMAVDPATGGYWLVASDGGIFSFGARFYGSTGGMSLSKPIVGMAATPDGRGYWLVASDGGVFSFGDAHFRGSTGAVALKKSIVGMAVDPATGGYWLVASDGGIFSFGARFYGSTGSVALKKPIVGMAPAPDGHGYWLVASDGGVFSFGDAHFHGSTGGLTLNRPIVGITAPRQLTVSNFSFDPQQQAAFCPGRAGNSASAPGVTSTALTVGNVSGITGLVPQEFASGDQAVTAAFDAVDHFGGVCGRRLTVSAADDQQSASNNAALTGGLLPRVLAFVGSLSDADSGGVSSIDSAGVADIGRAISASRGSSPAYWSATGAPVTIRNGRAYMYNTWLTGLAAGHNLPASVAVLSYSTPYSAAAGKEMAALFESEGVSLCFTDYSIQAGAQSATIPSDVRTAAADHCQAVFTTMDVVGVAGMLDALAQQTNYHPSLVGAWDEVYTPDIFDSAGVSAARGLQIPSPSISLTSDNPAARLYRSELAAYQAGARPTEMGFESWMDAEMFIYALLQTGRNPTRAALNTALSQITGWTGQGAFGPYAPSMHTSPQCVAYVGAGPGEFVQEYPPSGLYCAGRLVDVGPAPSP